MSTERNYQVIISQHMTDKAIRATEEAGQHVFRVAIDCNKIEVKEAIESIFGVSVQSVQIVRVKGKVKRFKQALGRRKDWKKAVVRLSEGSEIDYSSFGGRA